jgi:uncharacterized alpha-E superfamily protein
MVEPRARAFNTDRWLTDSRVYNLIWLGRWLERAENVTRVINTFARSAMDNGDDIHALSASLVNAVRVRGINIDEPDHSLSLLLKYHEPSSIYHSMATARNNATQVGTVELIRAISNILAEMDGVQLPLESTEDAYKLTEHILEGLTEVYGVIEANWFHRESLSEEEMYRRFVQQQ